MHSRSARDWAVPEPSSDNLRILLERSRLDYANHGEDRQETETVLMIPAAPIQAKSESGTSWNHRRLVAVELEGQKN